MREAVAHGGIGLLPAAETIQPVGHVRKVVVADKWRRHLGVAGVAGQRYVGFGAVQERVVLGRASDLRQSNQLVMCERSLSLINGGAILVLPVLPGSVTLVSARCRNGLSSCVPFSSTSFHRWLPSPPILISVACLPMMCVKLSQSLPKLVE